MASRYSSYRSSTTSSQSSSSLEFSSNPKSTKSKSIINSKPTNNNNLTTMMKKLIERKPKPKQGTLFIPSDVIAKDLKNITLDKKGTNFTSGLQKKLFGGKLIDEKKKKMKEVKALTEVKENTRTLAMVLRSERELLSGNKELQLEIEKLNSLLEDKTNEVEKLKDLCLKQREEIKSLKSAVLFPESVNFQLQELMEKQGSELKQAKLVIPTLQMQVSSLTGQLHCLAEGLAEVKAEKYSSSASARLQRHSTSPKTHYNQKVSTNSLEFSSSGFTTPASPDDVFLEDLNPCLTPYCIKEKMKEFEEEGYDSPSSDESLLENKIEMYDDDERGFSSFTSKLSKSSDSCKKTNTGGRAMVKQARRSDGSKVAYRKQMPHRLF
ncbi:hypothetical protein ACFE04_000514 [Oxalis oulophora]